MCPDGYADARYDGLAATRRIRAARGRVGTCQFWREPPKIFVEQVRECREAGMVGHMGKPFTQEALLPAVLLAAPARLRHPTRRPLFLGSILAWPPDRSAPEPLTATTSCCSIKAAILPSQPCAPTLVARSGGPGGRKAPPSPEAARSVLDGRKHGGILIAETDADATPRPLPASTGGSTRA
jgi:hypothetical protein